ncbi:MAG: 3-deoxy-manno-octulosonate cytidylyltransferase [Halanaerobiales bacterium]
MEIAAVIPARYQSNRFPGKPLAEIAGIPMINRVYKRVKQVNSLNQVIVATDDKRIYKTVVNNGGRARMTSSEHKSGTDRIAEVARDLDCDIIVNVQGDEPLIKPEMITQAIRPFFNNNELKMSTLKKKIQDKSEINDSNIVKVVTDLNDNALYFSRLSLPFFRNETGIDVYKHIGLYVFTRDFLLKYTEMEPTPLESTESLEQLRVLENGYRIKVIETEYSSTGVDVPEDIKKVEKILAKKGDLAGGESKKG